MATIAFIGLGNMGGPMAANLVRAGNKVVAFDLVEAFRHPPGCARGDEGGIFHASGGGVGLGIDYGQCFIRIRPVPFLEVVESLARDAFVPLDLVPVRGLHQEAEFNGAHLGLIVSFLDLEARAGRPGEIVNVIAVIGHRLRSVGVRHIADLNAACANDFILRDCQLHVIDAEIGEELRRVVVLVAIPGAVPPYADLRKPLAAEHEIALPSGARLGFGEFRLEGDLELNESASGNGLGEV